MPQLPEGGRDAGPGGADTHLDEARAALLALWPIRHPRLQNAANDLTRGRTREAESAIAKYLQRHPGDPDALNLMAAVAQRAGRNREAELHLAQCVARAPDHEVHRYNYAIVLLKIGKSEGALAETEILLQKAPRHILYRNLKAALLEQSGKYAEAQAYFRQLTLDYPDCSAFWLGLASTFRSLGGHRDECAAAFHRAAMLCPWNGKAWWNLASLKTFRFTGDDIQLMESQLARSTISAKDRADLHYALGKAYGDAENYERSFQNYAKGNAIRRVGMDYDADETTTMVSRNRTIFTEEFFRSRAAAGCPSREPIFVVGLQRAGSTLVEQILGSHSAIEGAGELPFVLQLFANDVTPRTGTDYPNGMDRLEPSDLRALGEKYLALAHGRARLSRPFFVDKCPFNVWHIGLIHLMLPNARIIDVRRHPLACCYANFTMSFLHAPPVSYRLSDMGQLYADYVRLTAHFDRVLPGKIYRVLYEQLVTDLEAEIRRLLDFLELPFEQGCLEYYKNERAFNSYSNEQVRSPIFTEGVDRWRNYEAWLGPLKAVLGPVLDAYPGVPNFEQ
jgi:tetratricopeptide (TPR) repeat protein